MDIVAAALENEKQNYHAQDSARWRVTFSNDTTYVGYISTIVAGVYMLVDKDERRRYFQPSQVLMIERQ